MKCFTCANGTTEQWRLGACARLVVGALCTCDAISVPRNAGWVAAREYEPLVLAPEGAKPVCVKVIWGKEVRVCWVREHVFSLKLHAKCYVVQDEGGRLAVAVERGHGARKRIKGPLKNTRSL